MNIDVVNSALQDLDPVLEDLFFKAHPLFDMLVQKGKVSRNKLEGRYKEFSVATGDPGQITAAHQEPPRRESATILPPQRIADAPSAVVYTHPGDCATGTAPQRPGTAGQ